MSSRKPGVITRNASRERQSSPKASLVERLKSIAQQIPQEELDRLPPDLIENLDHYLYGTRKR